jgi:hypothetical protein
MPAVQQVNELVVEEWLLVEAQRQKLTPWDVVSQGGVLEHQVVVLMGKALVGMLVRMQSVGMDEVVLGLIREEWEDLGDQASMGHSDHVAAGG